jgi:serine/threonine protein kinase
MVMEFVRGGELFTYLRTNRYFKTDQARFYAAHIVAIFDHLHSLDIIYR